MRFRLVLVFVALLFFLMPAFSLSVEYDSRGASMGMTSNSGSSGNISYFSNPASVFFYNQKKKMLIQTSFLNTDTSGIGKFFVKPDLQIKGQFIGKNVTFGLGMDTYADSFVKTENGRKYLSLRRFDFNLGFSYGLNWFSAGVGVNGGSFYDIKDFSVNDSSELGDFLSKSFFCEHSRVLDSEFIDIKLGLMAKYKDFSFSVMSKRLLNYEGNNKEELSFDDSVDTVCCGIYYDQDRYAKRGRLKKWVFSSALEGNNLFDKANRTLHAGFDVTYQLARDYSLSFRTGYFAATEDLSDGTHTLGLGAKVDRFDISLTAAIPLEFYKSGDGDYSIGIDFVYHI